MVNKKIELIVVSFLFLVIVLQSAPLAYTQYTIIYDWCKVSAYGTDLEEGPSTGQSFIFIVADPPSGSNLSNEIWVHSLLTDENYSTTLSPGDRVEIRHMYGIVESKSLDPASETGYFNILYVGEASDVRINYDQIPEFQTILIVPMFITATLLALIYRRKHKR